jgi:hypothetical protein
MKNKKKRNNPDGIEELKLIVKALSVDISWIKKELNELKNKIWWIISLIVGTLLTLILTKLI